MDPSTRAIFNGSERPGPIIVFNGTYVTNGNGVSNNSEYTWNNVSFGEVTSDRVVICAMCAPGGGGLNAGASWRTSNTNNPRIFIGGYLSDFGENRSFSVTGMALGFAFTTVPTGLSGTVSAIASHSSTDQGVLMCASIYGMIGRYSNVPRDNEFNYSYADGEFGSESGSSWSNLEGLGPRSVRLSFVAYRNAPGGVNISWSSPLEKKAQYGPFGGNATVMSAATYRCGRRELWGCGEPFTSYPIGGSTNHVISGNGGWWNWRTSKGSNTY